MKKMTGTILTLALLGLTQSVFADKVLNLDTKASTLEWTGKKVTGQHVGTLNFKSGTITLDDKGILKGAEFIVDMNSINGTDVEGEWKQKLEGHLKSDDFFATDKNPESRLKLQKVISQKGNSFEVEANLTIKGTTQAVKFNVVVDPKAAVVAKGDLKFDRTKFNIKYSSGNFFEGLGDKVIYDDVELKFAVSAK